MSGQSLEGERPASVDESADAGRSPIVDEPAALPGVALVLMMGVGLAGIRLWRWLAPLPDRYQQKLRVHGTEPTRAAPMMDPIGTSIPMSATSAMPSAPTVTTTSLEAMRTIPWGALSFRLRLLLDQQRYTPDTNNPFSILGRRFEVDRQGKRLWHRQARGR